MHPTHAPSPTHPHALPHHAQLLLGAARLVPTPRFFPLRLRLLRATSRLAAATGQYVPLAAPLLDMLHWAELSKPPKVGLFGGDGLVCEGGWWNT